MNTYTQKLWNGQEVDVINGEPQLGHDEQLIDAWLEQSRLEAERLGNGEAWRDL